MRTIRFGGDLVQGDLIVISYNNSLNFGWYIGSGKGTIQFYGWAQPYHTSEGYNIFLTESEPTDWEKKHYENGVTLKNIGKDYIYDTNEWRICKVNANDIFTDPSDLEIYEKSKEILINLNFIKR